MGYEPIWKFENENFIGIEWVKVADASLENDAAESGLLTQDIKQAS